MNQKRNQGYQRTHESIQDCFYQKMKKKPIRQITVGEICQEVDINRSTFYAHFKDVYDVMESIFEELNRVLIGRYASFEPEKRREESVSMEQESVWHSVSGREYTIILLEHLREYREFYRILLADPTNPLMVNSMKRLREGIADPVFQQFDLNERTATYCFEYSVSGFFAIVRRWLEDGCIETPEEIADIVDNMKPEMPERM